MSLVLFLIGVVAGAIFWDYAGEDVKDAILNRRNR